MKYIPVDKLLAEIDRQEIGYNIDGKHTAEYDTCRKIIDIINSLQQEQPTRGYDEAYLNECIAKARKTWKGVDVDKYMDKVRGREQEQPDAELISIANEWASHFSPEIRDSVKSTAYHFWNMARRI